MAKGIYSEALQHVRMLFEAGAVGGLTDRQLLERFRAREGEAAELAFTALVERHGPMILRVCRRTLRDEHDAQDAFQATFVVLVRKAGSLRAHDSIGGWLHAVACRVAACARAAEARRRVHERRVAEAAPASTPAGNESRDDLGLVLHEEIGRLPERYRAAVVLCDLEGLTQEQAAQRLGCPSGTVRSRLARGRDRLQARLTRRGLAPGAAGVAAALTAEVASAEVPAVLVSATVRAATLTAGGKTIAGAVAAVALSEGVLRAMFMTRFRLISAALLAIGAGAGTTAVFGLQQADRPAASATAASEPGGPPPPKAAEAKGPSDAPAQDTPQALDQDPAEEIERQISLARLSVKRAEDRVAWSDRMFEKGYVSKAQNIADKDALREARQTLERALSKRKPQVSPLEATATEKRERAEAEEGDVLRAIRAALNHHWSRSLLDDAELAGLPRKSRPVVVNWERAYALALIRTRAGRPAQGRALAEALDPKVVAEQAEKYEIGDFARFRTEFLGGGGDGTFRDPGAEILDLLRRRQEVENARWNIAVHENLIKTLRMLIQYMSSGLSQLQLDEADGSLQEARAHLLDVREHYRDQLDALKDRLGLSPRVAIVLDRESLAGFRVPFDEIERWFSDPQRDSMELPGIAGRLPTLDDVQIDGHSAAAVVRGGDVHQSEEEFLAAATQVALKNKTRGVQAKAGTRENDAAELELRVRGVLRRLLRIRVAYEIERRRFVVVVRGKDQAKERLVAPPRKDESPDHRAELFAELLRIQGQMLENQDRLVLLWSEYQRLRLALYRDLGTLPCDNWKSFYDQLTARVSGDHP